MNILVLNGSPSPNGNTKVMITAFQEGAELSGHKVTVIDVCRKKIKGCLACEYCHTKGNGTCVQKDDMQENLSSFNRNRDACDSFTIYYHGISGQLKCVIDRFYSVAYPKKPLLKKVAMILSSGDDAMYDGALFSLKGDFIDYLGLEDMGVFTAYGEQNGSMEKLKELKILDYLW